MIGQQTNTPNTPLTPPSFVHLFFYSFPSFPPPSHLTFPAQFVSYLPCSFSIFTPDLEGSKTIPRHRSLSAHCSLPYCDETTNSIFLTLPAIARCRITHSPILRCVVVQNLPPKKKKSRGSLCRFPLCFLSLVSSCLFLFLFVSLVFCSVLPCFSVGFFSCSFLVFFCAPSFSFWFSFFFAVSHDQCEFWLEASSDYFVFVSSELMDSCPRHLALFYQTQHQAWPLLLSVMFEHYLSWVELTRFRLSCPFLFGSFTSATSIESLARLIYSLQHDWYDVFVLARSWKQAAENSQQSFGTSTQAALRAIYIIVDSLISWLGHKKLKLHDFRRIIHKVLDIPTYHRLQRNTCLKSPIHWPYEKRWSKCELRYLEDLLLLTQHLHFVWVLFPEIHHFLTCFRSALRLNIDRLPKYCVLPYYQVISQTWCSLTPYLSPGDVTRLSMTRQVLLHLHRQMEVTYASFTLTVSSFPQKKNGRVESLFV